MKLSIKKMQVIFNIENKQRDVYYLVQNKYWKKSPPSSKTGMKSVFRVQPD